MTTLLIIGGYGFFGRQLAELLQDETGLTVLIAGRNAGKAQSLCDALKGQAARFLPLRLDRSQDLKAQINVPPDIIIDVSGSFQNYGAEPYRVVDYALAGRCDYLDIADGAEFVAGIAQFDVRARKAGRVVLSGVSTYPALTSCVVGRLREGLDTVTHIRAGIAPSPHNDMGRSVVDAIASYAGKRFPVLKDGQMGEAYGLTEGLSRTIAAPGVEPLDHLLFSNVDVPDGRIFGEHYKGLENIWNGAGPKPVILHRVLMGLARGVRSRLMPGLLWLSPIFHFCMKHISGGAHRGGMFVEIDGLKNGQAVSRSWHLIGEGDDGPLIPVLPLAILARKLVRGERPKPGARACLQDITLADYEAEFAKYRIYTGTYDDSDKALSLYEKTLGSAYRDLARPIQELHIIGEGRSFTGRCKVTRGRNPAGQMIANLFGMPKASPDIPVRVVMTLKDGVETWERYFDGRRMVSTQEAGKGRHARLVTERFGPVAIHMAVLAQEGRLVLKTKSWSMFGVPLPRFLAPSGDIYEHGAKGRFNFHVDIKAPLLGRLVKYEGWLEPKAE